MTEDTDSPFLNTREVAAFLRLTERTVYELVRTRQIPTVRVAGKWLFPRDLLARWLDENTDTSALAGRPEPTPAVLAGSHDPLLEWAVRQSGCGLALLCNGSEDGLHRVDGFQAMLAAVHLRDPEDGSYNITEFSRMTHRRACVLMRWATRRQGLLLPPGNPMGLNSLGDVLARGARLVARQPGAGSRRLLDDLLREAGAGLPPPNWVAGLAHSESEVAQAIVAGRADAGLAIECVAAEHRLGFLALHEERLDLVLRRFDCFEAPVRSLLRFCDTAAFRERAGQLPGYDLSGLGEIIRNG